MTRSASQFIIVSNEAELSSLVAQAAHQKRGVLVTGGRDEPTRLAGEADFLALSLAALDEVVEFEPDDLTVTVQAGMTLTQLQGLIAAKGQRLAMEAPFPDTTTVGAAVAQNLNGFIACLYGELPEQVLGLRSVTGDGSVMRSGGRVVKNVTGYDTRKLLCGSSGTLGLITEICFRLRPRCLAEQSLKISTTVDSLPPLVRQLRGLSQKLSGLALRVDPRAPEVSIYVRAEGAPASLKSLQQDLENLAIRSTPLDAATAQSTWAELRDFPRRGQSALCLRYLPAQLGDLLAVLAKERLIVADLMAGRLKVGSHKGETAESLIAATKAQELIATYSCLAALDGDPEDATLRQQRFGQMNEVESIITNRLKATFDPEGILMRGRLMQGSL